MATGSHRHEDGTRPDAPTRHSAKQDQNAKQDQTTVSYPEQAPVRTCDSKKASFGIVAPSLRKSTIAESSQTTTDGGPTTLIAGRPRTPSACAGLDRWDTRQICCQITLGRPVRGVTNLLAAGTPSAGRTGHAVHRG